MPQVTNMLSGHFETSIPSASSCLGSPSGRRSQSTLGAVWLGKQVATVVRAPAITDPRPHFFKEQTRGWGEVFSRDPKTWPPHRAFAQDPGEPDSHLSTSRTDRFGTGRRGRLAEGGGRGHLEALRLVRQQLSGCRRASSFSGCSRGRMRRWFLLRAPRARSPALVQEWLGLVSCEPPGPQCPPLLCLEESGRNEAGCLWPWVSAGRPRRPSTHLPCPLFPQRSARMDEGEEELLTAET